MKRFSWQELKFEEPKRMTVNCGVLLHHNKLASESSISDTGFIEEEEKEEEGKEDEEEEEGEEEEEETIFL